MSGLARFFNLRHNLTNYADRSCLLNLRILLFERAFVMNTENMNMRP